MVVLLIRFVCVVVQESAEYKGGDGNSGARKWLPGDWEEINNHSIKHLGLEWLSG